MSKSEIPFAKDYAMKKRIGHTSNDGLSRREVLLGGLAAVLTPRATAKDPLTVELDVPTAPKTIGVRTIDIHAHYYPQAYFDLFVSEGQRFDAEFRTSEQGFFFKTRAESDGPLPTKFID